MEGELNMNTCQTNPIVLTAGVLRNLMGDRNIPELAQFLEGRLDDERLSLLNRHDYFATKLWCEEDIANSLEEQGYEGSSENIAAVFNRNNMKHLEDCTYQDWDCIYSAIAEAADAGELTSYCKE